jgi:MYXO-CTERM domain-containing protein
VKFGKAITWKKTAGSFTHDADKAIDLTTGTRPTATFEVPAGTADVFVQIANKGDSDGAYDDLTIELAPETVVPPASDDPAATPPADTTTTESISGCGCSTPGAQREQRSSSIPLAGLFAAVGLAAGVVRRRRR